MKRIMTVLVLGGALALSACSGTKALYQQAETPVDYAKAVLLHHNALGNEVVALLNDPAVSDRTKGNARAAYRLTVCSPAEVQGNTSTAECDEGPAYVLDKAIVAYTAAATAQSQADITAAANAFIPLVTALIRAVNDR